MQWRKSFATLVACFLAIALTACGGGSLSAGGSSLPTETETPITISTQPDSQSVATGQTATFFVVASSSAELGYQWKKNSNNINGATSSMYTTPPASSADNGAVYSVSVSNSTATVTSNATLTVTDIAVAPAIATQPADQIAITGQTATFSVTATGTSLRYQWQKDGTNIPGATSSSYTTAATSNADNGARYSVTVSNSEDLVTSSSARLTVSPVAVAPAINTQPIAQTVTEGQTAGFSVTATGTGPLTYQWKKNGTNIPGATSSTYTTDTTVSGDNNALFSVVIGNSAGTATSSNATLTVSARAVVPAITTQPAAQSVTAGQSASFSVTATGTGPLTYQWKKNGINISGAISSAYTIPATAAGDANAVFTVEVSNSAGTAISITATLTVTPAAVAPAVTSQPAALSVTTGQTATFSVIATGTAPLRYQWMKNGLNVTDGVGGTTGTYTTPATVDGDNNALFTVVVSNSAGTVTSSTARLTVAAAVVAPAIGTQPTTQTVTAGQSATFLVTAIGTSPSYQWKKNGTDIPGATSSTYTTSATINSDNAAVFTVVVSNSAGTVTSSSATLTVIPAVVAPTITTQPAAQTVTVGQTATFSVTAAGSSRNYQWRKDGSNIPGATSSSYTTPATSSSDNGAMFTVVVSNSAGGVTSSDATLTVNLVAPAITTPPAAQTVIAGQTATFSVSVTGTSPNYQWRKNGSNINGATSSSYTTPATVMGDNNAVFTVVVSNSVGTVTSSSATLSVFATRYSEVPKTGGTYAKTECVKDNSTGLFWEGKTASGTRSGSNTYTNYDSLSSAQKWDGSSWWVSPTQTEIDATTNSIGYRDSVRVSGLCGFSDWRLPTKEELLGLVVSGSYPTIDTAWFPNTQTNYYWSSVPYPGAPHLAWYVGFGDGYVNANPRGSGYHVRLVRNSSGAPIIAMQPAAQTITAGNTATFSVTATGTGTLIYQWKKGSTVIPGATNSSYTTPAMGYAGNGAVYSVVVTDSAGSVTSSNATLTVNKTSTLQSYGYVANASDGLYDKTECVQDNNTGLVWEGKTAWPATSRLGTSTYTNYDSTSSAQKSDSTNPTQAEIDAITNSIGYKNSVNTSALCGYTDWRLPTKEELQGILASSGSPWIDTAWFSNTQANLYWSSSPYVGYSYDAWFVGFNDGYVNYHGLRYDYGAVRLVRASQ